jgi:uncharacterized Zn finger protein
MENLAELKTQVLDYCEKRKKNGGKVAQYECPNCKSLIMNITPNKKGEVWDSVVKCYECGELHFAVKKMGEITATALT